MPKPAKTSLFLSKRRHGPPAAVDPAAGAPAPPSTIVRSVSKDDGSVVSELTGLSADPPVPPSPARTHGSGARSNPHPPVPAAAATSLLSSQYYGGLQASASFDTGFDTALQPLTEVEEERSSVQRSGGGGNSSAEGGDERVPAALPRPDGGSGDGGGVDFLLDDPSEMTLSRRVALRLMRHRWYYQPRELDGVSEAIGASMMVLHNRGRTSSHSNGSGDARLSSVSAAASEAYPFSHSRRESPSLAKAWAYFEHVALPRHVVEPKEKPTPRKNVVVRAVRKLCCKAGKELRRAEPGERDLPTRLYEPIFTPHKQLGDFGLGIGLYFSTLRAMTVITVLAGLLNIPNFIYFSSPEYSSGQPSVPKLLQGSAICTDTQWVPCPDCRASSQDYDLPDSRIGYAYDGATPLVFALRNACDGARLQQGMVNYATVWLILVGVFALNRYLKHMEVRMDEDEQTAQDYSIVVQNPPPDATDPHEWKSYFDGTFGTHVTACTVAVDNDLLVRSLVERREILRKIEMSIEPGTAMDRLTLAGIAAKEEQERTALKSLLAKVAPGLPELFARLVVLTAKVQGLAQQSYPATNIFVTFETEADQRRVLTALRNSSALDRVSNNTKVAKDPKHLFRGTKLLAVAEPDEPSTIRWQDLNETTKERAKQQSLTLLATFAAITLIAFLVQFCNSKSVTFSAFAIAIFNALFPMFAKWLNSFEAHASAGGVQRSLYCKIALFRWVNTAVVITIITPFTSSITNGGGLIAQIYALFFAEIVTTNAIQLLDPVGHLKRHILAPRAATQDSMNLQFQGTPFELAERYTNMTKIVFLALWYCAIYPGALFMCAFTLFINYFVDRFSLMRTWKRQPHLGTTISEVSRRYFFSLAIVAMAVISSYYWASFPFDNLCPTNATVSESYVGSWTITPLDSRSKTNSSGGELLADVQATDYNFQYCLQDFLRYPNTDPHFPFIPTFQPEGLDWMTDEQVTVTRIYGWSAVGVILLVLVAFAYMIFKSFVGIFLKRSYKPTGKDQGIAFSDVPSISTYVPQVESNVFSYPLLACNVDQIDEDLLEWTDPDRPHYFYDLTKDAEVLTRGMDVSSKVVFSQIYHWVPPKK